MGAQRVQVFNPLDQVIQDRPLQDPSQAYRHIEEGLEDSPTTNRSTRATVP